MTRSIPILLAMSLALPTAFAVWGGHGSWEPDYAPDVSDLLMWADADQTASGKRVYFNAFLSESGTSFNPNTGQLTQSRIVTPNFQQVMAFFGVWKDCNKDGYVGMLDSAVTEYRSELLLDVSICPPSEAENAHNDGEWVYEFIWIGSADNFLGPETDTPFRFINDTEARAWVDFGLAGDDLTGSGTCYTVPMPTGTFASTGGMIGYFDCFIDRAVGNTVTTYDPTGQLTFGDPRNPQCSNSLLNQDTDLFADDPNCNDGNAGHLEQTSWDDASVTVSDCSNPLVDEHVATGVDDPRSEEPDDLYENDVLIGGITPRDTDLEGSHYETLNQTSEGTIDGCDGENAGGLIYPSPEGAVTSNAGAKRETDLPLDFGAFETLAFVFLGPNALGVDRSLPTGEDTPRNFGVAYPTGAQGLAIAPRWRSQALSTVPSAVPVRGDVTTGESLAGAPPTYMTSYARVGAATAATGALTPGGQGTYGVEWCGSDTSNVILGFDCDKSRWWKETEGASAMATELWSGRPIGQVPGAIYNLRDVDCYDGTVSSAAPGVGLGLTLLDETHGPCA